MTGARVYRWDDMAPEKVTEMMSRKIVAGARALIAQVYLKKGALVPLHAHESEQLTYVLQGSLRMMVAGEESVVRAGEIIHIPSGVSPQAEALADTLELDLFRPVRADWLADESHSSR